MIDLTVSHAIEIGRAMAHSRVMDGINSVDRHPSIHSKGLIGLLCLITRKCLAFLKK